MSFHQRSTVSKLGFFTGISVLFVLLVVGEFVVVLAFFRSVLYGLVAGLLWFTLVTVLSLLTQQTYLRLRMRTQSVTGGRATTLEKLCDRFDIHVRGARTTPENSKFSVAEIAGLTSSNLYLFVIDAFFDRYDSDEQTAILVREWALANNYYQLYVRTIPLLVLAGYYLSRIVVARVFPVYQQVVSQFRLLEIAALIMVYFQFRLAFKLLYDADDRAAAATSPETVIQVLKKTRLLEKNVRKRAWPYCLLWMRPSINQRIERLQKRYSSDAGEPAGE